ncbi:MAG: DUF4836 family protein [Bacteroidota bacterium]
MNKKSLFLIAGVVTLSLIGYAAFKFFMPGTGHLKLIPKNSMVVMTVDIKEIGEKIDFDGKLKDTRVYRDIMKEQNRRIKEDKTDSTSMAIKELLENPLSTGVNVFSDAYLFVYNDGKTNFVGVTIDLNDKGKWEKTVKKLKLSDNNFKKGEGYKCLPISETMILAWNDKGLLFLNREFDYYAMISSPKGLDRLESVVGKFMNQTKEESILAIPEFGNLKPDENDASLFINYDEYNKQFSKETEVAYSSPAYSVLKSIMANFKGVYACCNLNFEDNQIAFKSKLYGDPKNLEKINYMKAKGVSEEALDYITGSGRLLAVLSANIDLKKIAGIVSETKEGKQLIADAAEYSGLTSQQLENLFSGELTLAVTDIKEIETKGFDYQIDEATGAYMPMEVIRKSPMPMMTFNVGVNNVADFDTFTSHTFDRSLNSGMPVPMPMGAFGYAQKVRHAKGCFISNDTILSQMIQNNNKFSKKPDSEMCNLLKSNSGFLFFDLNLNHYPSTFTDIMQTNMGKNQYGYFKSYMSLFKDIRMIANGSEFTIEINLQPGEGNAIYRIIKQSDYLPARNSPSY